MSRNRLLYVVVALALPLAACGQGQTEAAHDPPAAVTEIEGTELSRITLVASAAERLGIETATAEEARGQGRARIAVPYSAILYAPDGRTWVYTNPEELVYQRAEVVVDSIDGDQAILSEGLAEGDTVVTIGAAELFGTETGVGGSAH
jgi:hypothetical protein